MSEPTSPNYFDATNAVSYDARWARLAPLRDSLHLLIGLVLEDQRADARVLCVGAGTGAELTALARIFPSWRFVALDPSEPMIALCRQRAQVDGVADRCEFHTGYVDDLPDEAVFDLATSLLVSHFIMDPVKRTAFFSGIARRLRPEGILVTADLCSGATPSTAAALLDGHLRMMRYAGVSQELITTMSASYGRDVAVSSASEIESILTLSGFATPVTFSQQLMMRAWYAQKSA